MPSTESPIYWAWVAGFPWLFMALLSLTQSPKRNGWDMSDRTWFLQLGSMICLMTSLATGAVYFYGRARGWWGSGGPGG